MDSVMLHCLRQYRRQLAGSFASLLAAVWLSLALAPCTAMADGPTSQPASHHATKKAEDHCPHCDQVEAPCVSMDTSECELPAAIASTESVKPMKAALPAPAIPALPQVAVPSPPLPAIAESPPHPPLTRLYCRFQE